MDILIKALRISKHKFIDPLSRLLNVMLFIPMLRDSTISLSVQCFLPRVCAMHEHEHIRQEAQNKLLLLVVRIVRKTQILRDKRAEKGREAEEL